MIKTNYHTHTYLCHHAQGLPIDYVKAAIEKGYQEIGISDHGPLYERWTLRMNMNQFYQIYLQNIAEAKYQYGNKIKIYRGLELEYLEGYDEKYRTLLKDLDYLILGQHIVIDDGKHIDIFREMNDRQVILYKEAVLKAIDTGYFRILAHPDIYMFRYRTWNNLTEAVAREIIEAAIRHDIFLEINCNGIRRGEILTQNDETTYIYPRLEFWRVVSEYQEAKVMIGEDDHTLNQVDDEACYSARQFAHNLKIPLETYLFGDHHD
jgi:histidinol-phosphatase (PHP family)